MIRAGIIGTGNIGTDLLFKILKSNFIIPLIFVGRRKDSIGIKEALKLGINVSYDGIDFFVKNKEYCDIVFDCTDAVSAIKNNYILSEQGIKIIDLTPSKIGEMCIPIINGGILRETNNINMVTCGGQAAIPILNIFHKLYYDIDYIEVVSQIASDSAGMATRSNIDEYIETTELAVKKFTKCKSSKVILNLNPANPCVDMQTTMYLRVKEKQIKLTELMINITKIIERIRETVPGYELTLTPIIHKENIIILGVKVIGNGDFLPSYAGNLDIITSASIHAAKYLDNSIPLEDDKEDMYD